MKSIGVERELEWCRMRRKQQIATNGLKPANICQCNTILGPPRNSPARFSYCNNAGKTRRNLSQRGSATSDWALSASIVTRAESLAGGRRDGGRRRYCLRPCVPCSHPERMFQCQDPWLLRECLHLVCSQRPLQLLQRISETRVSGQVTSLTSWNSKQWEEKKNKRKKKKTRTHTHTVAWLTYIYIYI